MENPSLSVPDLLQTVKTYVSEDKHAQLDEMLSRYKLRKMTNQQLQFELRMLAGRDALRQALLAMVPQIDELQKKREAMKLSGGGGSSSAGGVAHPSPTGGAEEMPPLQGGQTWCWRHSVLEADGIIPSDKRARVELVKQAAQNPKHTVVPPEPAKPPLAQAHVEAEPERARVEAEPEQHPVPVAGSAHDTIELNAKLVALRHYIKKLREATEVKPAQAGRNMSIVHSQLQLVTNVLEEGLRLSYEFLHDYSAC